MRKTWQVSHADICTIILFTVGVLLLLRRTYKMFIYYTDNHDVDEDMTTIPYYSGHCTSESRVGIAFRAIDNTSSVAYPYAASRCQHLKNLQLYEFARCRRGYENNYCSWWVLAAEHLGRCHDARFVSCCY